MNVKKLPAPLKSNPVIQRIDRAFENIGQLAMYEAEALDGHLLALREHLLVARKARGVAELLRDQFDLLPATAARLARDHRQRRQLWRRLGAAGRKPAGD